MNFNFSKAERNTIVTSILSQLEAIYNNPREELAVNKAFNVGEVRAAANSYSFEQPNNAEEVMLHVIDGLKKQTVHVTHPSYLGLFNPRPNFPSVMADVINSYLNPQLAVWQHAPYAVEIEQLVLKAFAKQFGYSEEESRGIFCIGGSESNQTAVLTALQKHFPNVATNGLVGLQKQPLVYGSKQSHHSVERAARSAGLGKNSVRRIPTNPNLTMDVDALRAQIVTDIENGHQPFMVVGTSGTTGAGMFDNLDRIAEICAAFNLWFHVDAAYGGGAIITDLKHYLKGIEKSDSITLDLHKWFSVPMATSIFLTSDAEILSQTFNLTADYMPEDGDPNKVFDNYANSLQWSRRFIGLKIYLPLAILGWEGYSKMLSHQIDMGNALRSKLKAAGWQIENQSELPIVCFTHPAIESAAVQPIIDQINITGKTWISSYPVGDKLSFRAQIANYDTRLADLDQFMELLAEYKEKHLESCAV